MASKKISFWGSSRDDIRSFPRDAQDVAGFQLHKVQHGEDPDDWKPMAIIGAGVREIRIRDAAGAFRVIYLAKLPDAVYVLHCFQKKTEETSQRDITLAQKRYKELMRGYEK